MALIFSTTFDDAYAYQVYDPQGPGGNLLPNGSTAGTISIYEGIQPSTAQFEANWVTAYRPNAAPTAHLAHFTGGGWARSGTILTYTPGAAVTPTKAGTASFAVIWATATLTVATMNTWTNANLAAQIYTLAPVTLNTGNGVVRFSTLTFTTSTPVTMIDAGISLTSP